MGILFGVAELSIIFGVSLLLLFLGFFVVFFCSPPPPGPRYLTRRYTVKCGNIAYT